MRKLRRFTVKSNSDLFVRRFVLVIPSWLAIMLPAVTVIAVYLKAEETVVTTIAMIMSGLSAVFCRIAWTQLREMRYALHSAISDIETDEYEDEVERVPHA